MREKRVILVNCILKKLCITFDCFDWFVLWWWMLLLGEQGVTKLDMFDEYIDISDGAIDMYWKGHVIPSLWYYFMIYRHARIWKTSGGEEGLSKFELQLNISAYYFWRSELSWVSVCFCTLSIALWPGDSLVLDDLDFRQLLLTYQRLLTLAHHYRNERLAKELLILACKASISCPASSLLVWSTACFPKHVCNSLGRLKSKQQTKL